ncbi:hypothetical protein V6N13_099185 [Hibiscus sabdariffa]
MFQNSGGFSVAAPSATGENLNGRVNKSHINPRISTPPNKHILNPNIIFTRALCLSLTDLSRQSDNNLALSHQLIKAQAPAVNNATSRGDYREHHKKNLQAARLKLLDNNLSNVTLVKATKLR